MPRLPSGASHTPLEESKATELGLDVSNSEADQEAESPVKIRGVEHFRICAADVCVNLGSNMNSI